MTESTSYICEHTAEFTLLPVLKKILLKKYDTVTPIFPWITREGSNFSKKIHANEKFNILGMYPRRPKIQISGEANFLITINDEIVTSAKAGLERGIPIIAGCPLAYNFWSLGNNPKCLWIKLCKDTPKSIYVETIDDEIEIGEPKHKYTFSSDQEITRYSTSHCRFVSLDEAIDTIKLIRRCGYNYDRYYPFIGGYKPVYFLMK